MLRVGGYWRKKKILDLRRLSSGWVLLKTENRKSPRDFMVRVVTSTSSFTPRHAHFAIDLYGKLCHSREGGMNVLKAIVEVWHSRDVNSVLRKYADLTRDLPGYDLEYILCALNWILEQEDVNFTGRSKEKQRELDEICRKLRVETPPGREGSQLAIALLCDIAGGTHPVEAFLKAGLDIRPRRCR